MGAITFTVTRRGKTAKDAFDDARDDARAEVEDGGYSGTIAEKRTFVMVDVPSDWGGGGAQAFAEVALQSDVRIQDKWGPAGCISLGDGKWLFFGWASY